MFPWLVSTADETLGLEAGKNLGACTEWSATGDVISKQSQLRLESESVESTAYFGRRSRLSVDLVGCT